MQIFNSSDNTTFLYNGTKYVKNFIVIPIGSTHIAIYNSYDTKLQLLASTHYSQVSVDNTTFGNQEQLINTLSPLVFAKASGGSGSFNQNNQGLILNYPSLFTFSIGNTIKPADLATKINSTVGFTVSETQTPILIQLQRYVVTSGSIGVVKTKKYVFLFNGGKGSWGKDLTPVTANNFTLLYESILTPNDVIDDENSQINALGEVADGNYIVKANLSAWDFFDETKDYYFSYTTDGVLYFVLFIGENGLYGLGNVPFTENMFVDSTNSENEDADIIPTLQQVIGAGSTASTSKNISVNVTSGHTLSYNGSEVLNRAQIGIANGIAPLDNSSKIPVSYLPNAVMVYKGMWNLSTNTPVLSNGSGSAGWVYKVTGAATPTNFNFGAGNIQLTNGDFVIYSDTSTWEKSDGSDSVTSVNGYQGVVNLSYVDVGAAASAHTHTIAQVTSLQGALDLKAPLASPALNGVPTAPTAAAGTNNTQIATTAFATQIATSAATATVSQTITDGVTASSPSQNAVSDALLLKANANGTNATGTSWPIGITGNAQGGFGGYNYIDALLTSNVGNFLVRKADNTSWQVASQATIINTLGINLKADDSLAAHLAGTETFTGQKTFTQPLIYTGTLFDSSMNDWFTVKNKVTSGGWGRGFRVQTSGATDYISVGAFGTAQAFNYGFIGLDNNATNAPIKWNSTGVGINFTGQTAPTIAALHTTHTGQVNNFALVAAGHRRGAYIGGLIGSTLDTDTLLNIGKSTDVNTLVSNIPYMLVWGNGNTTLGGAFDSGEKLQVNGDVRISGDTNIGSSTSTQSRLSVFNNNAITAKGYAAYLGSTRSGLSVQGDSTNTTAGDYLLNIGKCATPAQGATQTTFGLLVRGDGTVATGGITNTGEQLQVYGTTKIDAPASTAGLKITRGGNEGLEIVMSTAATGRIVLQNYDRTASAYKPLLIAGSKIVTNQGNLILDTTTLDPTDTGEKLQVNGTAKVTGQLTIPNGTAASSAVNLGQLTAATTSNVMHLTGNEIKTTGTTIFRNTVALGVTSIPGGVGTFYVSGTSSFAGAIICSDGGTFGGQLQVPNPSNFSNLEAVNTGYLDSKLAALPQTYINSSTTALSNATLNSTYNTAVIGSQVIAASIASGAAVYIKIAASTWKGMTLYNV